MEDKIKETEAERILKNIREDSYVITLEIKAKEQGLVVLDSVLDNPSLFYRQK